MVVYTDTMTKGTKNMVSVSITTRNTVPAAMTTKTKKSKGHVSHREAIVAKGASHRTLKAKREAHHHHRQVAPMAAEVVVDQHNLADLEKIRHGTKKMPTMRVPTWMKSRRQREDFFSWTKVLWQGVKYKKNYHIWG
jgi:hypothetical protein